MKFLCDADRCIECNACTVACKNEHDVPWGINRRRVVTINDGKPGERSISMACMHCTDAPCAAVCPVNCFYTTVDAVVLHSKDLCIGCGYCFYACPFGAPQYPKVGNFGSRGKMDKCTYCAAGPRPTAPSRVREVRLQPARRGQAPALREMCSTKSLLAGDGEVIARSTRSASSSGATAPAPGAGRPPTARRWRSDRRPGRARPLRPRRPRPPARTLQGKHAMHRFKAFLAALALVLAFGVLQPAAAQTANGRNPTAESVREEQLLQELGRLKGTVSIPDGKAALLEQPQGRDYRQFREVYLPWISGIFILGMIVGLAFFFFTKGRMKLAESPEVGIKIKRFNAFERFTHWITATTFVILAISGLNYIFGKRLLMPLIGPDAFAVWSQYAKYAHLYLAWPFMLGVILMFLVWVKDNIPNRIDVDWVKAGGGLVGDGHPDAERFNAGQKGIFWIVVLGGFAMGRRASCCTSRSRSSTSTGCRSPSSSTPSSAWCSSP
jgi:Fe-S-cluster-containing dehydrogenase component